MIGLFIGVSDYSGTDGYENLPSAAGDALKVFATCQNAFGLDSERSFLLADHAPGRAAPDPAAIHHALGRIHYEHTKPTEPVFVWYSGHGVHEDGSTYCVVANADGSSPGQLDATAVSLADIFGLLDRVSAQDQIVILDCCRTAPPKRRSRGTPAGAQQPLSVGAKASIKRLAALSDSQPETKSRIVLMSCDEGEQSFESDETGGWFASNLISSLASFRGERVSVVDWFQHTCERMSNSTLFAQRPQIILEGGHVPHLRVLREGSCTGHSAAGRGVGKGQWGTGGVHAEGSPTSEAYAERVATYLLKTPPRSLTYYDAKQLCDGLVRNPGSQKGLAAALIELLVEIHFKPFARAVPSEYRSVMSERSVLDNREQEIISLIRDGGT